MITTRAAVSSRTPARVFEQSRGGQPGGPWRARYCIKGGLLGVHPPRQHEHGSNCGLLWITPGERNLIHAGKTPRCPQSTALITTTNQISIFSRTTNESEQS